VLPADIDEDALSVGDPWQVARTLAFEKAAKIQAENQDALVIGADTVVAYQDADSDWHQLAKPVDSQDAERMLGLLSGRTHSVITGIAVLAEGFKEVVSDTTQVAFRRLSPEEITAYVATGEPLDKAGAYAIQGGAKGFVDHVEGSISNVIGLPLETLRKILAVRIHSEASD
jgi:septum formation protein